MDVRNIKIQIGPFERFVLFSTDCKDGLDVKVIDKILLHPKLPNFIHSYIFFLY
jgi:hypothetical protein